MTCYIPEPPSPRSIHSVCLLHVSTIADTRHEVSRHADIEGTHAHVKSTHAGLAIEGVSTHADIKITHADLVRPPLARRDV